MLVINNTNHELDFVFNPYDILHKGDLVDVSPVGMKVDVTYNTKLSLLPGDVKVIIGK